MEGRGVPRVFSMLAIMILVRRNYREWGTDDDVGLNVLGCRADILGTAMGHRTPWTYCLP